jgi:hypothetical protein
MTTLKELKKGAILDDAIYLSKPYVIIGVREKIVLFAGTLEQVMSQSSYYDDCTVDVRRYDFSDNDNRRIKPVVETKKPRSLQHPNESEKVLVSALLAIATADRKSVDTWLAEHYPTLTTNWPAVGKPESRQDTYDRALHVARQALAIWQAGDDKPVNTIKPMPQTIATENGGTVVKKLYELTDGHEIERRCWFSDDEYERAVQVAFEATDGMWGWRLVNDLPVYPLNDGRVS